MSKSYSIDFVYSQEVTDNGFFGIGTSKPNKMLDVYGDLNYTGALYNNQKKMGIWNTSNNSTYFTGGNVGINTNNPQHVLDVAGNIRAETYITNSDQRLKTNIRDETLGLQYINTLKPKIYNYINHGEQMHGFIAQDILQTNNTDVIDIDNSGYYTLELQGIIAPIVKALQELKAENDYLENRLQTLQNGIAI